MVQNYRVFLYIIFSKKKILNGNHTWPTLFLKVEKLLLKMLSKDPHPTSWQYPLKNYPEKSEETFGKETQIRSAFGFWPFKADFGSCQAPYLSCLWSKIWISIFFRETFDQDSCMLKLKLPYIDIYHGMFSVYTPPIAEIIWVKNVRAIVVCGFLMK